MACSCTRGRARARGVARPVDRGAALGASGVREGGAPLDLDYAPVPLDEATLTRRRRRGCAASVDERTALVVASAFSYPHGVLDDVAAVAAIAAEARRRLPRRRLRRRHGAAVPRAAGVRTVPPWDFRVPGVTSMSVDLHKYGYVPKGCSVVLHRDADWAGAPVVRLRPLARRALRLPRRRRREVGRTGAWRRGPFMQPPRARRLHRDRARPAGDRRDRLRDGIEAIDGVEVIGDPVGTHPVVASDRPDVSTCTPSATRWRRAGWFLNRLTGTGGGPAGLHVMVSPAHGGVRRRSCSPTSPSAYAEVRGDRCDVRTTPGRYA